MERRGAARPAFDEVWGRLQREIELERQALHSPEGLAQASRRAAGLSLAVTVVLIVLTVGFSSWLIPEVPGPVKRTRSQNRVTLPRPHYDRGGTSTDSGNETTTLPSAGGTSGGGGGGTGFFPSQQPNGPWRAPSPSPSVLIDSKPQHPPPAWPAGSGGGGGVPRKPTVWENEGTVGGFNTADSTSTTPGVALELSSWYSTGKNTACRLDMWDSTADGKGSAVTLWHFGSKESCMQRCEHTEGCKGIEYSDLGARCEIWVQPILFHKVPMIERNGRREVECLLFRPDCETLLAQSRATLSLLEMQESEMIDSCPKTSQDKKNWPERSSQRLSVERIHQLHDFMRNTLDASKICSIAKPKHPWVEQLLASRSSDGSKGFKVLQSDSIRHARTERGQFLGNSHLELGISTQPPNIGGLGTKGRLPPLFGGRLSQHGLGLDFDQDGIGHGLEHRADFLHSTVGEAGEAFYAGFMQEGKRYVGENFGSEVQDTSGKGVASARTIGYLADRLEVIIDISMLPGWPFYKTTVRVTNVDPTRGVLENMRFVRSMNAGTGLLIAQDGPRSCRVGRTVKEDGVATVSSQLSLREVTTFFYISDDPRAVASFGNGEVLPTTVYDSVLIDHPQQRRQTVSGNTFMSIAFDIGKLQPTQTVTFSFYTAVVTLRNPPPSAVLESQVLVEIAKAISGCHAEQSGLEAACGAGFVELDQLIPFYQKKVLSPECGF